MDGTKKGIDGSMGRRLRSLVSCFLKALALNKIQIIAKETSRCSIPVSRFERETDEADGPGLLQKYACRAGRGRYGPLDA